MSYYLAGPMRGYKRYNFPRFTAACKQLRHAGLDIVSPHEMDLALGFNPRKDKADDGPMLIEMLERDMSAVLHSNGVIVLPGWQNSRGATAEVTLALAANLPVYTIPQAIDLANTQQKEPA